MQLFKPCLCYRAFISWAQHRQYLCKFPNLSLDRDSWSVLQTLPLQPFPHKLTKSKPPGATSWKYIKHTYFYFQRGQGNCSTHTDVYSNRSDERKFPHCVPANMKTWDLLSGFKGGNLVGSTQVLLPQFSGIPKSRDHLPSCFWMKNITFPVSPRQLFPAPEGCVLQLSVT